MLSAVFQFVFGFYLLWRERVVFRNNVECIAFFYLFGADFLYFKNSSTEIYGFVRSVKMRVWMQFF